VMLVELCVCGCCSDVWVDGEDEYYAGHTADDEAAVNNGSEGHAATQRSVSADGRRQKTSSTHRRAQSATRSTAVQPQVYSLTLCPCNMFTLLLLKKLI